MQNMEIFINRYNSISRCLVSLCRWEAFSYTTTNVHSGLIHEYSSNEKCSNKSNKKRTKRQRDEMSLVQQVAPGAVAGRKTPCHLPPCLMHMTFLACAGWQKGHGCVPVPHEGRISAISGAEYKWGAVWCTLSSPRYLLLWNAAVTSLNIWLPTD